MQALKFPPQAAMFFTLLFSAWPACSSSSNFGGSGGKTADNPPPVAETPPASQASATSAGNNAAAAVPGTANSAGSATASGATPSAPALPQGPIDISKSGFQCSPQMQTAQGEWAGTYKGSAVVLLPVSGNVHFAFTYKDAQTMAMQNFFIEGGLFGGDTIKSIAINFDLHCGDLQLQNAVVQHEGITVSVALAMTQQSWNPPSLSGTWKASPQGTGPGLQVATGTWTVKKN